MNTSKFTIYDHDDRVSIKVFGEIDSNTKFPEIDLKPNQNIILLQLDEAGYINSGGVQCWTQWILELQKRSVSAKISIQMLPSNFARLSYTIQDFIPKSANIESFVAPFHCTACSKNFFVAFKKGDNWNEKWTAPELVENISLAPCPDCKAVAEIDTAPETYKNF